MLGGADFLLLDDDGLLSATVQDLGIAPKWMARDSPWGRGIWVRTCLALLLEVEEDDLVLVVSVLVRVEVVRKEDV